MAFAESSDLVDENGTDMLWDPTADEYDPVYQPNAYIPQIPYFGGKHFIYVLSSRYDGDSAAHSLLMSTYDSLYVSQVLWLCGFLNRYILSMKA